MLTQDPQGWRLREYHHPSILKGKHRAAYETKYQASSSSSSTSSSHKPIYKSPSHLRPPVRPVGQPLSAFIPRGLSVTQLRNGGLEVFNHLEGARSGAASEGVFYYEVPARKDDGGEEEDDDEGVWDEMEPKEDDLNGKDDVDVIIEGESIQPMFVPPGRQTMMVRLPPRPRVFNLNSILPSIGTRLKSHRHHPALGRSNHPPCYTFARQPSSNRLLQS